MEHKTEHDDGRAEDRRALGRALRELRKRAELTQEELAARAGTDNTYISHAEAGRFGVGWDTVMRLVRAMDSTISELASEVERQPDGEH
jgi:transcriptional regulator with XRE-family HTH domain